MTDRNGPRDVPARIEALIQAALCSEQGKRKMAAAQAHLSGQLNSGRLTAEIVLETFKRFVDLAVANQLSRSADTQAGYHAYAKSGLSEKTARRLADEFLTRAERPYRP